MLVHIIRVGDAELDQALTDNSIPANSKDMRIVKAYNGDPLYKLRHIDSQWQPGHNQFDFVNSTSQRQACYGQRVGQSITKPSKCHQCLVGE